MDWKAFGIAAVFAATTASAQVKVDEDILRKVLAQQCQEKGLEHAVLYVPETREAFIATGVSSPESVTINEQVLESVLEMQPPSMKVVHCHPEPKTEWWFKEVARNQYDDLKKLEFKPRWYDRFTPRRARARAQRHSQMQASLMNESIRAQRELSRITSVNISRGDLRATSAVIYWGSVASPNTKITGMVVYDGGAVREYAPTQEWLNTIKSIGALPQKERYSYIGTLSDELECYTKYSFNDYPDTLYALVDGHIEGKWKLTREDVKDLMQNKYFTFH